MKKVTIIGMGTGVGSMTADAKDAIVRAQTIIGSERLIAQCKDFEGVCYTCTRPTEIAEIIACDIADEIAVLVSGDVGFYSAAEGLAKLLHSLELRFIPGVSSVNAFFARLGMPWQDAVFISAHGREAGLVSAVRRNHLVFCLTGNNAPILGKTLVDAGFGMLKVYVGETLGMECERIYETTVEGLLHEEFPALTVFLFLNDCFDSRTPAGLPDSVFCRSDAIPMTKCEIRALILSKLRLKPEDTCWDVGAGSGSVTAEMALNAYNAQVFAIERREAGIELIQKNCRALHIGNVTAICGSAPASLSGLPAPDAVFIGGSGGELAEIIKAAHTANPKVRLVITSVTVETGAAALSALASLGLEPEIVQISAARGRAVGKLHLLEAQNPVTIISAGGTQ